MSIILRVFEEFLAAEFFVVIFSMISDFLAVAQISEILSHFFHITINSFRLMYHNLPSDIWSLQVRIVDFIGSQTNDKIRSEFHESSKKDENK